MTRLLPAPSPLDTENWQPQRRLRASEIDGLRAIAVIAVLLHHAFKYSGALRLSLPELQWHLLLDLAHGVDLFFVISGFCLSYPVFTQFAARGAASFDVARYCSKRLIRILPPYYAAIILFAGMFIVARLLGANDLATMTVRTPAQILGQFLFLDKGQHFLNGSFWTLAIEFRWYIVFPMLLVVFVRSRALFAILACACVVMYDQTRAGALDVGILPAFMLGIAAAYLRCFPSPLARYAGSAAIIAAVAAFALDPQNRDFYFQDKLPWQLAAFFTVWAAGAAPALRSALGWRPLAFIGTASYSIYLVHEPVINALEAYAHQPWWLAAAGGAGIGVAFWAVCERLTEQQMWKSAAVRWLCPHVAAILGRLGVPLELKFAGEIPIAECR